jgi:hypothetical protein
MGKRKTQGKPRGKNKWKSNSTTWELNSFKRGQMGIEQPQLVASQAFNVGNEEQHNLLEG